MKTIKSFCSIILVLAVLLCIGMNAFAHTSTSYSIDIPYDFTETISTGNDVCWENTDGSVAILAQVREVAKDDKRIHPSDISDAQLAEYENSIKKEILKEFPNGEMIVISTSSSIMEFGEHSVIRVSINAESFGADYYFYIYVFETVKYTHMFIVMGEDNIYDFADNLINTVRINDEPVERDTMLRTIAISVAIVAVCIIVIVTWFRIKRKGLADSPRKWVYIAICVASVIVLFIKVVMPYL